MPSINAVLLSILGLNLFAVLLISISHHSIEQNKHQTIDQVKNLLTKEVTLEPTKPVDDSVKEEKSPKNKHVYNFIDPPKAYQLLKKLDVFEGMEDGGTSQSNYNLIVNGFTTNKNYCNEHRAYFVGHPEIVFDKMSFITNYWKSHKVRTQVMPRLGNDLHPEIHPGSTKSNKVPSDFRLDGNIFFMFNLFQRYRQVGKQFSCLSQASNHIPGHDKMARKDKISQALTEYTNKYKFRPDCFNSNKYFPKSWTLQNKAQCEEFFKEFNSEKYQKLKKERNIVYFRKIGADVHEGKGVFAVDSQEEKKIRKLYANGTLCGKNLDNNVIQYNVHNLLLINNHKFGFRQYLLIASTNPLIVYFHDGYARLSLNEYDPKSKDPKTFVTNIGVNIKAADSQFAKMTHQEIQEYTCWFLDKFQQYLLDKKMINDQNWLDNYLRPEFKRVLIHLVRMAQSGFVKKSSVFELFGIDYVMDNNLKLWFIEANAAPLVNGFTKGSTKLLNRMLADMFEIVFGLLRSRMKRVVNYINKLSNEVTFNGSEIPDLAKRKQEFKEITKNYFESEFKPSAQNTFSKIIDENETGTKRYSDLLEERCL